MNLVESFSEFKAGKNIDRPTMVRVLEDVFRTLIRKKYGSDTFPQIILETTFKDPSRGLSLQQLTAEGYMSLNTLEYDNMLELLRVLGSDVLKEDMIGAWEVCIIFLIL